MIQKKLLGEIMAEMGFVSREQLEEALERQRRDLMDKMLPERLERVRLVSEARLTKDITPMLGQMLMDLGFVTRDQISEALDQQDEGSDLYAALQSDKLGKAIEIEGVPGFMQSYEHTKGGIQMRYMNYDLYAGRRVYDLSAMAPAARWDELSPDLEAALLSFKVD